MANSLVTPSWVMKEVARILVNSMRFAANVDRSYDSQYAQRGAKVGYTVNARLPQRYQVTKGQALTLTAVADQVVPITLTDQAHVGIEFSTASLTMEVDDYRKRYIEPAVGALVNAVDNDGLSRMYKAVYQTVGTPGVVPGSTGTLPGAANIVYLGAGVKLSNASCPAAGRKAILSPEMHAYLSSANVTLFNPSRQISDVFKSGLFATESLGISEWYMDQNVATHTTATKTAGVGVVTPAVSSGSALACTTFGATDAFNEGDVIQCAGTYAINPVSFQSTGQLQDFVLTANATAAGGAVTLNVSPSVVVSGPQQTVSNAIANNSIITIFGTVSPFTAASAKASPQGLVYHPDAFSLVMADLEMPGGLWVAERISNKALGISVRFLKDYSISTDQSPARLDILYGWKCVRPELACRVCS